LALGADAVLVGRTILYAAVGGGAEGVKTVLAKMGQDLAVAMMYSGCKTLNEINSKKIGKYDRLTTL
jgi:isopentenyl diphosphate isomerase/L-lactate dehydrogenase-like FMN-dependent dehydrogenase